MVKLQAALCVLLIVAAGLLAGWWWSRPTVPKAQDAAAGPVGEIPPGDGADARRERQRRIEFFETQVLAQLETTDEANRQAASRCIERIEQNFQRYREGVDGFVDELTGIRSRLGILKRMPGEWWTGDQRVNRYVTEKFEQHLFSQATLTSDLRSALEAFRAEVRANQVALLSRTRAAIEQSDLPPIRLDDYEAFFGVASQQIGDLAGDEAKTTVTEGMVALIVSEAGSTAVGMIAGRLVSGLTASAAASIAASGGATAGGAAAGAAGGSVVPGAGTLVGFGVGLVVGLGIDYWMNQQTAAKLRTELLLYINAMESDLLLGPAVAADNESPPQGVAVGVDMACERLRDGVHQRLFEIIVLDQS